MKTGESWAPDDGLHAGVVGDELFPKGNQPSDGVVKKIEADKQTKAALFPAADIIAKILNQELDKTYDLRDVLKELNEFKDADGEKVREELRLRDRYRKLIVDLAQKLSAALKEEVEHE